MKGFANRTEIETLKVRTRGGNFFMHFEGEYLVHISKQGRHGETRVGRIIDRVNRFLGSRD